MKRLLAAALLVTSGVAFAAGPAYVPPAALCSTEITYTIKDASGAVMDETTYTRAWPIDCVSQVKGKYLMLQQIFTAGEARFNQLIGE